MGRSKNSKVLYPNIHLYLIQPLKHNFLFVVETIETEGAEKSLLAKKF